MKNSFLFLSALLFFISINGMENEQVTIEGPFFNTKKQEYFLTAQCKEKEIGSATYYPYRGTSRWYLSMLQVDSAYQKKGIATQLLRSCIRHAQENHASCLEWHVLPKNIDMSDSQLIAIYYRMLAKIDPGLVAKTTQEERGDQNWSRTFLILTFD